MLNYFPGSVAGFVASSVKAGPSPYSGQMTNAHGRIVTEVPLGFDAEPIPGAHVKDNFEGKGYRIETGPIQKQLDDIYALAPGFSFDAKALRGALGDDDRDRIKLKEGQARQYDPALKK